MNSAESASTTQNPTTSIAFASQKGGVGKTTLILNLAYALAKRGHRTLLVDTDPQGGIGLSLIKGSTKRNGLTEWLGSESFASCLTRTRMEELAIMTVGSAVSTNPNAVEEAVTQHQNVFEKLIADAQAEHFDLVLFDTHAGLHGVTGAVLDVVDQVVVPLLAEPLGLRTLPHTLRAISTKRLDGAKLKLSAIIATMVEDDQVANDIMEEARRSLPSGLLMRTTLPRDILIRRASMAGVPLGLLTRAPSAVALQIDQLAAELEPVMGLGKKSDDDEQFQTLLV